MLPAVQIKSLRIEREGRALLNNVSLSVPSGQYLVIAGANGAGKSTLLRCIGRIIDSPRGTVLIEGRDVLTMSSRQIASIIGYVPQTLEILFPHTVLEFVLMGRYAHLDWFRSVRPRDLEIVKGCLESCGVAGLSGRIVSTLSGGEKQLVLLAAALAQEPRILVLDEPTTYLDPAFQARINAILLRLQKERALTIVAATHDINTAAICAGRIAGLKSGEICFDGAAVEFMRAEVLDKLYGHTFHLVMPPSGRIPFVVPAITGADEN